MISSDDSEEYIRTIGAEVSRSINAMRKQNERISVTAAAVFAALNYCDDCRKAQAAADNLRSQIKNYVEDASRARMEADEARREIDRLSRELHTLRARGYRLAVCSSADRVKVLMNLSAIGAEESLFDQLVTGTDIKNPKPDPEIYLTGAASLGLAPSECIVVEDAPSGIRAAHAAGIEAIGLATSFPADYLRQQAQPEYLLPDLKSILTLL